MNISVKALPGLEISETDLSTIESLAARLTPQQSFWVSGYLAGFARARDTALPDAGGQAAVEPAPGAQAQAAQTVTVFYASETGNAAGLAKEYAEHIRTLGWQAEAQDLASYKGRNLGKETCALFICSTHGEGDPPEPAAPFFEFLEGRKAPKLEGLRYAVLGLGDSTYEHFCGAAKTLDERLAALGGQQLLDRADCDVDYEEPASDWLEGAVDTLRTSMETQAGAASAPVRQAEPAAAKVSKSNPALAPIIENIRLTGRGSNKETRHIEFALDGSGLHYTPGDALGIYAQNDPALVDGILSALELSGEEPVTIRKKESTLAQALSRTLEVTALTPRFIEAWAEFSGAGQLSALLADQDRSALLAYMGANHVQDLISRFPVKGIAAQDFANCLRGLQPRLYSIASSQTAIPDEVHIAAAVVRYQLNESERLGVTTGALSERLSPDDTVPVFVQENENFRMPADGNRPMIMIGAGTGVAPYRAFMQELEETDKNNPAWLFFGEQHFRTDFLYQTEWQAWHRQGVLDRIDLAFSRDADSKVYVQDRLKERSADVYAWLEDGAAIYVCGDADNMAPDVHRTLVSILQKERACSLEEAEDYLRALQSEARYQRDVY